VELYIIESLWQKSLQLRVLFSNDDDNNDNNSNNALSVDLKREVFLVERVSTFTFKSDLSCIEIHPTLSRKFYVDRPLSSP